MNTRTKEIVNLKIAITNFQELNRTLLDKNVNEHFIEIQDVVTSFFSALDELRKINSLDDFLNNLVPTEKNYLLDLTSDLKTLHRKLLQIIEFSPKEIRDEKGHDLNTDFKTFKTDLLNEFEITYTPIIGKLQSSFFLKTKIDLLEKKLLLIEEQLPKDLTEEILKKQENVLAYTEKQTHSIYEAFASRLTTKEKEFYSQIDEIESRLKILEKDTQNKTSGLAADEFVKIFNNQAKKHRGSERCWLGLSILTATLFSIYLYSAISTILKTINSNTFETFDSIYISTFKLFTPIIFITSFASFIIFQIFKTYNANRHLRVVNEHKANSLEVYKTLIASIDDKMLKECLIKELANHIYDLGETGFITARQDKNIFQDVIKLQKS